MNIHELWRNKSRAVGKLPEAEKLRSHLTYDEFGQSVEADSMVGNGVFTQPLAARNARWHHQPRVPELWTLGGSTFARHSTMITWTKKFETGSAKLDQQHRLLIDNINLLKDLLDTPELGRQEAEFSFFLVDYLESYADIHFKGEEKCMEAYRCPVHTTNQQEHQRFRGFIHDYKRLCEVEGFTMELLRNLHEVMRTWIVEHILKVDTQLKSCIQKQQVKYAA